MNKFRSTRMNQRGFSLHFLLPLIVVAVVALVGYKLLFASHADSSNTLVAGTSTAWVSDTKLLVAYDDYNHNNDLELATFTTSLTSTAVSESVKDLDLGMYPGTAPSITALSNGGYQIAFEANNGDLWTTGTDGTRNLDLGMYKGSSPSIAGLNAGGYEIAFEANTGDLWTVGSGGGSSNGSENWKLGMYPGSSPSITGFEAGGIEIAFEANNGDLWTVGQGPASSNTDWKLGMYPGSSPSITNNFVSLSNNFGNAFEVAFTSNDSQLWTVGSQGNLDFGGSSTTFYGVYDGSSPGIETNSGCSFDFPKLSQDDGYNYNCSSPGADGVAYDGVMYIDTHALFSAQAAVKNSSNTVGLNFSEFTVPYPGSSPSSSNNDPLWTIPDDNEVNSNGGGDYSDAFTTETNNKQLFVQLEGKIIKQEYINL